MRHDPQYPPDLIKLLAARADEARGLLDLVRPLCKKATRLTATEAKMLREAVSSADHVLNEAMMAAYEADRIHYAALEAARNGVKKGELGQ